ncbi:MAG TPA: transposase [Vicinamibacterales bacterium]|nr:transposase [Vicinamibacterales bacterium]
MDARQLRGLELAATKRIRKAGTTWVVPSQTSQGRYHVTRAKSGFRCTCPDYELRGETCKHGFAVEFFLKRTTAPDGTVTETRAMRISYPQDWRAYNAAQTTEKATFCTLLRDLVGSVPEPEQKRGRPSLPIAEKLFAAAFKVYSTVSGRRFMTDLRASAAAGHISRAPHYNSIFNVIDDPDVTPILQDLIVKSALPLQAVETAFAVDSTGFGTNRFYRHFTAKYGGTDAMFRNYVKLHASVGVKTNVIAAAEISDRDAHDGPMLPGLVRQTAEHFALSHVVADKAYSSRVNLQTIQVLGATPFVPFKSNAVGNSDSPMWNRLFHFFHMNRAEFLATYHQRSNAESAFSSMKRLFGDNVRSKTEVSQTNEVLLKVLCHNLVVLIHEMHETGAEAVFHR